MTSQRIDSRISELRDFISYFAPGNIVEYGSFIHKKQPFRNYFEEGRYKNSSRNSGYGPYEKGYDRRYQPTRDKKPKHSTCFNSSGESTPEDMNDSPRSTSESISSPDSNPNPTPRDTDPLPLSPNLDVVKMQLEALSRIPSPIDDTLPPVDGFKLNQTGINKAFKDITSFERSPRVHVGGKTVRLPPSEVFRSNSSPRGTLGGKGLPITSRKAHPARGGKGVVRPVTSGKQIPYHGVKMSLSSEDESDISTASDSDEVTDSSDEEVSIGTIPYPISSDSGFKRPAEQMQQPLIHEDEEDTIVVDDLDVEIEGGISQQFDGSPVYARSEKIVASSSVCQQERTEHKGLIVKLKLPTVNQLKPRRSLIVKLQIPTSLSGANVRKRPLSPDNRQFISNNKKICLSEITSMNHEHSTLSSVNESKNLLLESKSNNKTLTLEQQALQMRLEAEELLTKGDGYQERAVSILTHSLFYQMLYFCELEGNKEEESQTACDLAYKIKVLIRDVVEQHVSCGNLGIAGLLMKMESILTFRVLNLQNRLIKTKTAELKRSQSDLKVNESYLNTVQKFTDDFQSVTKTWHDAEAFLTRDPILTPTTRDTLSLFTPLSHIIEVTKAVVPL